MKKTNLLCCVIATCFSGFAHAHVLDQPDAGRENAKDYPKLAIKQPILYGNAHIVGQAVPTMVIPALTQPDTYTDKYLYAPMRLKRNYSYLLTRTQAKHLALYVAGAFGVF